MPVGWFIAAYVRRPGTFPPTRYCRMDDFTAVIRAEGGDWREAEALGDRAVVKVRASAATLTIIAGSPGMRRLPFTALDIQLSTLTGTQRTALRGDLTDAGYTTAEIDARFPGNFGQYTTGEVLRFLTSRRRKPRWDQGLDVIVFDGPEMPGGDVDGADRRVGDT